jgi:hypothetical protein
LHDAVGEKGDSYRVLEDVLSLPDWSFQKRIECLSDNDETLRSPGAISTVPVDCSNISLASGPVAAHPHSNPVHWPVIKKVNQIPCRFFLKTVRSGTLS